MDLQELPLFSRLTSPEPIAEKKFWTVTELTTRIRGVVEPAFTQVWVQGEVSNFRPANSGHVYFSLKDQGACISAAAFGWGARKKSFELKDGLQILCKGKVTLYPPRGSYQFIVESIEPMGVGALQVAFEQLKAKLASEGLFHAGRKKKLPAFPTRIAVVTSPSGAAIQDMLNILRRRAPHMKVMVIPALVQGDEACSQIVRGLELANQHRLGDIVVLARGGGSIEDLWCFNQEDLARAIAKSQLPVISAVGHEIDFTISDFVSDLRAPTPSAAAEIVSGSWVEAVGKIQESKVRLKNAILRDLSNRKTLLKHIAARVVSPRDRLREQAQRCDDLALRLERAIRGRIDRKKSDLGRLGAKLDALSPLRVLERGYTLVKSSDDGCVTRSANQVRSGKEYTVVFQDGEKSFTAI